MKRSLAFLVVVLFIPPLTAYAASTTSQHFVVRNTPAEPELTEATTPELTSTTPPDEPSILPDDAVNEIVAPVDDQTTPPTSPDPPASTTPAFTGELEQVETGEEIGPEGEEQGEPEEIEPVEIEPEE